MALTKDQKKAQVTDLREALKKAKSVVFMKYRGLTVSAVDDLRGKMNEKDARMKVAKKTLFNIAANEEGLPEVPEETFGKTPVAVVFSFEDEMSGAKVAFEFGKSNDAVELVGGILNGKVLNKEQAIDLAKMLSKDETLAKFAAMLRAPLVSFASMCDSPLGGFARAVKEIAEKKEKEAPAPAPVAEAKTDEGEKKADVSDAKSEEPEEQKEEKEKNEQKEQEKESDESSGADEPTKES
jgi:large subunit ribosomal protein L10